MGPTNIRTVSILQRERLVLFLVLVLVLSLSHQQLEPRPLASLPGLARQARQHLENRPGLVSLQHLGNLLHLRSPLVSGNRAPWEQVQHLDSHQVWEEDLPLVSQRSDSPALASHPPVSRPLFNRPHLTSRHSGNPRSVSRPHREQARLGNLLLHRRLHRYRARLNKQVVLVNHPARLLLHSRK